MNLVIECLKKELERQNLLIATNEEMREEINKHPFSSWPRGPMPEEVYSNMEQFRDELESAIVLLETYLMAKT